MPTFHLLWSPEGRELAIVDAVDAKAARRKAPKPYRKFLGEIIAMEVLAVTRTGIYTIKWFAGDSCCVYSSVTGACLEMWSHGAWLDNGLLPDHVATLALGLRDARLARAAIEAMFADLK